MKVQKWYWKDGVCIGYMDEQGNEVKITLKSFEDVEFHTLYHEELKRRSNVISDKSSE